MRTMIIASLVVVIFPLAPMARAETPMTDEEIRDVLKDRIERAHRSVGIVVGIIDDKGARIIAYGKPSLDSKQTVDGDTVFEIGSITKVFTATLLADMAQRGDVSLDDPISKYLPKSTRTPTRNGKEITLRSLATHMSGLPRDGNITSVDKFDPNDPLANYTAERMYEFLSGYALTRDIGAKYEYSNVGVGLLGHILTLRADTDYENLVRTRICQPLRMESTGITLSPKMKTRLATGYNRFLKPVPYWNWDRMPGMQGCGALRSTVHDMLKFVAANMGLEKTPLTAVMETTHVPQHDTGKPQVEVALGWNVSKKHDSEIISHGGNTTGHSALIAFDKKKRQGVVILANFYESSINDIAFHILNERYPLAKLEALKEHKAIKLDGKKFDPYIGEYQIAYGSTTHTIVVSREEERFFMQAAGSKQELLAESETEFFIERLAVTITFVKDDNQQVTKMVFNNDSTPAAKKIK